MAIDPISVNLFVQMAKTSKSEIDALFKKVKKVKPVEKQEKPVKIKPEQRPKGSSSDPLGAGMKSGHNRKYTEEGWPIYTEEELNIGKGGETADCPFDCQCCF